MSKAKVEIEDGEWGDKPLLITINGKRVVSTDNKKEALDIKSRLEKILDSILK